MTVKATVLGSNGWYDDANGLTTCVLVESARETLIFDAGSGLTRALGLADFSKPATLFLTHLHMDHIIGLHTLSLYPFEAGLTIVTPLGGRAGLDAVLRPPFMTPLEKLPYPTRVVEAETLPSGALPFAAEALPLVHAVPATGYRVEIDGKRIAFVLDTADCGNAAILARGVDLLITEAGFLPGQTGAAGHLDPEGAAELSVRARAKKTLLIHFGASGYTDLPSRLKAVGASRGVFPNLIAGTDWMEVVL